MAATLDLQFDTPTFKGVSSIPTGLFINGEFVEASDKGTIEVINPATGKVIGAVAGGTAEDVDRAVAAAQAAFKASWGRKVPGGKRRQMLLKLADLIEERLDEFAAIESLNVGKPFHYARNGDIPNVVEIIRYYAGWADKISGKSIATRESKMCYTRREPFGVCGQIIPWNFPMGMLSWKIAPALATGNTVILKPSEITPLTALKFASLVNEAGFPPGVLNIVNGYGHAVGRAISEHPDIRKVAFTGSTLTGRKILEASARTNLKVVTLELGGKSPSIIFDDADVDHAIQSVGDGIFFNSGQVCTASCRVFVQEGIYDRFLAALTDFAQKLHASMGDPFAADTRHQPQVSKLQYDKVMDYIRSGKAEGANVHLGGESYEVDGFYIKPTVFTGCTPDMRIVREEIFGPVATIIKFKDDAEVVAMANDTSYGLACGIFSTNIDRALRTANELEAGTAWVNSYHDCEPQVPFGGYKQSGIGRELGEDAIETYTEVKSVHVTLKM